MKHQVGLVWNEVSRRYVDDEPEFFMPDEWRGRPVNAKQGSNGVVDLAVRDWPSQTIRNCLETYNYLLDEGVAPEQARMVLPQNTMTEFIWTGSVAAFARIAKLRLDPHTQLETQEIAKDISTICSEHFPVSWEALVGDIPTA